MTFPDKFSLDKYNVFCAHLGEDPMMVQGAGGNFSWKIDDTLWIKASGTQLSRAVEEDIFVATDLRDLLKSFESDNFEASPKIIGSSTLRPSIETMLHALMPQKFVIHLHMVDALALLVLDDCVSLLKEKIKTQFKWSMVNYYKPGSKLARAVADTLNKHPDINLLFLRNHGIVLAAESLEELTIGLNELGILLSKTPNGLSKTVHLNSDSEDIQALRDVGYSLVEKKCLTNLVTDENLLNCIEEKWVLCPDHAVFLGSTPTVGSTKEILSMLSGLDANKPPFVFCKNFGVFQKTGVSRSQIEQLICYYDVLIRIDDFEKIVTLNDDNVSELVDWEAEKYRISLNS